MRNSVFQREPESSHVAHVPVFHPVWGLARVARRLHCTRQSMRQFSEADMCEVEPMCRMRAFGKLV